MKNIHILPTDQPSRLYKSKITQNIFIGDDISQHGDATYNLNIYITSDVEIKDVRPHKGKWQLEKGQILNQFPDYLTDLSECKLVIMTTDPQLIADGIQAIDDEFLEWFVKNPSCEKVEVEKESHIEIEEVSYEGDFQNVEYISYKIIIPKEEPKQETLEEAAEKYAESNQYGLEYYDEGGYQGIEVKSFAKKLVDFTTKWQAERMYSEDEVRKLLQTQRGNCYVAILTKNKDKELAEIANNAPEPSGYNGWVKQFKKK
jgi:hypothetical protein